VLPAIWQCCWLSGNAASYLIELPALWQSASYLVMLLDIWLWFWLSGNVVGYLAMLLAIW